MSIVAKKKDNGLKGVVKRAYFVMLTLLFALKML